MMRPDRSDALQRLAACGAALIVALGACHPDPPPAAGTEIDCRALVQHLVDIADVKDQSYLRPKVADMESACSAKVLSASAMQCQLQSKTIAEAAACGHTMSPHEVASVRHNQFSTAAGAACFPPWSLSPSHTTGFNPIYNGFYFRNDCDHGCCEGMSYGALDYYFRNIPTPIVSDRRNTSLQQWILTGKMKPGGKIGRATLLLV